MPPENDRPKRAYHRCSSGRRRGKKAATRVCADPAASVGADSPTDTREDLLTMNELADRFKVARRTLDRWLARHDLTFQELVILPGGRGGHTEARVPWQEYQRIKQLWTVKFDNNPLEKAA